MTKIAGSGSFSQRHGSPDPDPHQNVMDPELGFFVGVLKVEDEKSRIPIHRSEAQMPRIRIRIPKCPVSTTLVLWTSFGTLCSGLDPCDIVPSDYVLSQLESLGQILSYCLVEGGQAQGGVSATPSPLGQSPPPRLYISEAIIGFFLCWNAQFFVPFANFIACLIFVFCLYNASFLISKFKLLLLFFFQSVDDRRTLFFIKSSINSYCNYLYLSSRYSCTQ
jgi:hypothetical protein